MFSQPDLYAGAMFINELSSIPNSASIIFLLLMSGMFSIVGILRPAVESKTFFHTFFSDNTGIRKR